MLRTVNQGLHESLRDVQMNVVHTSGKSCSAVSTGGPKRRPHRYRRRRGTVGVGVGAASERDTLSAASVGRDCSVSEPTTSTGGGDRGQTRRLGAVLAARVDGCSSHDVNPSSPGGAIDAPGSAVVGVGAASERDALSAASVGLGCSVGEPTTSVDGGDRTQPRRLGAALAARADGCLSHDVNPSPPGGAIDAPGSAVIGVGAASERDALSAASVGHGCSVGESPTSVGGCDRGQSRRLGAALAALLFLRGGNLPFPRKLRESSGEFLFLLECN